MREGCSAAAVSSSVCETRLLCGVLQYNRGTGDLGWMGMFPAVELPGGCVVSNCNQPR